MLHIDGQIDGWINRSVDIWMDEWIYGLMDLPLCLSIYIHNFPCTTIYYTIHDQLLLIRAKVGIYYSCRTTYHPSNFIYFPSYCFRATGKAFISQVSVLLRNSNPLLGKILSQHEKTQFCHCSEYSECSWFLFLPRERKCGPMPVLGPGCCFLKLSVTRPLASSHADCMIIC